ncbi:MAG: PH domain-containing protein [Nitriliruptoraceae bacterium]
MPSDGHRVPPGDGSRTAPTDVPTEVSFSSPRALHPASIVVGVPVGQIVQSVLVPGAALIAVAGRATPLVFGLVGIVGLVVRIAQWRRFRFSFDGAVVRIDHGVLARRHRSIDVGRIQQVELDQPAIQRLCRVASVRIETAGSSREPDIELRVLGVADARALRSAVRASPRRAGGTASQEQAPASALLVLPIGVVARSAVTGAQLLVLPTVLAGALQFVGDRTDEAFSALVRALTDEGLVVRALEHRVLAFVATAAVLLAVSVVTALVVGIVREGGFRIDVADGDLRIRRGLLGTRESTVPRSRVQSVHVQANPLRRALGIATVRVSSAGGGEQGQSRVTIPAIGHRDALALAETMLDAPVPETDLVAHPRAARARVLVRALLVAASATGLGAVLATITGWPGPPARVAASIAVITGVTAVAFAFADHAALGHAHTNQVVAARHGAVLRTLSVAPVLKVQACTTRATWFQQRRGLATCTAHVAGPGGDVRIRDGDARAVAAVHAALRAHAARSPDVTPPAESSSAHR